MAIDLTKPINHRDADDPAVHALLEDLQGNILKEHGRSYSMHLFLQFPTNADALAKMPIPTVTSRRMRSGASATAFTSASYPFAALTVW